MIILDKILGKNKKDKGSNKNVKPANAQALINEGNDLIERREYAEAVKCYNKAIKLTPASTNALNNKGMALAKMEKFRDAVNCYDKALKINIEDIEILFNKGIALERLGNYGKALRCYDDILEIKPGDADAWCGRGDALFGSGSFEEAFLAYERALEIAPDDVAVLNNRGLVLYRLNRFSEAVESYSKAIEINPKLEKIRSNKNTALAKMKENGLNTDSLEVSVSVDEDGKDEQLWVHDEDNENFVVEPQHEIPETDSDSDFRTIIPIDDVAKDTGSKPVAELWTQDEDNENFVVEPQPEMPEPEPDPGFDINPDELPFTESDSSESGMDENSGVQDSDFWTQDEDNDNFVVEPQPEIPEPDPDSDLRTVIPVEVTTDTGTEPVAEFWKQDEDNDNFVVEPQPEMPEPDHDSDLRTVIPVEVTTDTRTEPVAELWVQDEDNDKFVIESQPEMPEPEPDSGFDINPGEIPVPESGSFEQGMDENAGAADSEFWKQDEDNENFVVDQQPEMPEPDLDSGFDTNPDDIPVSESGSFESGLDENAVSADSEFWKQDDDNENFVVDQQPEMPEPDPDFGFNIKLDDILATYPSSFKPRMDENAGAADSEFWKQDEDNENFVVEPQHGMPEPDSDFRTIIPVELKTDAGTESAVESGVEPEMDENADVPDSEFWKQDEDSEKIVVDQPPEMPEPDLDSDFRTVIPVEVKTDDGAESTVEPEMEPENLAFETQAVLQPDIRHHETMNKPEEHILNGNSLFSKRKYKEAMDSYHKFAFSGLDD